ncbi:MAG: hypothetical protein ACRDTG_10205 [Pseudonocardiaceae bacterium]
MTLVALAVLVLLLGTALPESPGAMRLLGVVVVVSVLGWVTLSIWWFLRLRPPRPKPAQESQTLETPGLRWVRILVAVLCVPVLLGFGAVLYHNGLNTSVLIGGIVGPTVAVLLHRRRLRTRSQPGGRQ